MSFPCWVRAVLPKNFPPRWSGDFFHAECSGMALRRLSERRDAAKATIPFCRFLIYPEPNISRRDLGNLKRAECRIGPVKRQSLRISSLAILNASGEARGSM